MRLKEIVIGLFVWGGLLLACLSLRHLQALNQHSVCGPWGCGPPTNALLAVHVGWTAVIWPPLLYFPWRLKFGRRTMNAIAATFVHHGGRGGRVGCCMAMDGVVASGF